MTNYTRQDLNENWEFKILRSASKSFRNPATLRRVLEEEGRAGWILVEKFDNERIRLKRPMTARDADSALDFDPYRSYVGLSEGGMAAVVVAVIFGVIGAFIGLVLLLKR
jgi:hypothetical protein